MKLFSKLYRLNILAIVSIFILSSVCYYLLIRFVVLQQFDESLQMEQVEIEQFAASNHQLPEIISIKDRLVSFTPYAGYRKPRFETGVAYDTIGRDTAAFRKLFFAVKAGDQWYMASVGKSMEGVEHLIHTIIAITITTILLILLVSAFINRVVLKNLWQPFYNTLQIMKDYQVGRKITFSFPDSKIDEFTMMTAVLRKATKKADDDYLALREFTDSASHEMQTPLAIIRSKLDLVIQDEEVSARHNLNLQVVYNSIDKLNSLNRSLLLLAKIGNNQFSDTTVINLGEKITGKIAAFQEMIEAKQIKLSLEIAGTSVMMDSQLLDILLNNLLSNAIKHNVNGGEINIRLNKKKLVISNSGNKASLDKTRVFTRFYKSEQNNEFTGLGLSIMKQVCIASQCDISYYFEKGRHLFTIEWTPDSPMYVNPMKENTLRFKENLFQ